MYRNILLKVGEPNDGIILDIVPDTNFVLNEIIENPVDFLNKHGALGFTGNWVLSSLSVIGGNDKDVGNIIKIIIFSEKTRTLSQEWLFIKLDKKLTHLEIIRTASIS